MKSVIISRCLLGDNVRYDGGNCLLPLSQLESLRKHCHLIPVCPEVMANMGTPRDPIEFLNNKIINKKGEDLSLQFDPVKKELDQIIRKHNIKYALLKEFSPSCGVTQLYSGHFDGEIIKGSGIIAAYLENMGVKTFSEEHVEDLLSQLMI